MRGVDRDGVLSEMEMMKRRVRDQEILADRAQLIWDHRFGVGVRSGFKPMPVREVAKVFNLHRIYVHRILKRKAEIRQRLGRRLA
jgi:DNA-directed RNA polymerase specialized sigma subunit